MNRLLFSLAMIACAFCLGCSTTRTTDTARTGMEQLLISNAIDQTMNKTALPDVAGKTVYLEEKYLDSVDKGYIVGTMRRKLLNAGVGTDNVEQYVGMPGLTGPGLPVELPEVRLYEKKSQFGTAKIGVVAYDTPTGQMVYDGGGSLARANDSNWTVLGIGPFQEGSVRNELNHATGGVSVANAMDFSTTIR